MRLDEIFGQHTLAHSDSEAQPTFQKLKLAIFPKFFRPRIFSPTISETLETLIPLAHALQLGAASAARLSLAERGELLLHGLHAGLDVLLGAP